LKKLASLDIGKYYDPDFQDAMSVVGDSPGYPYVFSDLLSFLKSAVTACFTVYGIAGQYPAAAIMIALFHIPTLIVQIKNSITDYDLYRSEENDQRRMNYYRNVLTGRSTAAELRLYGYEELFRSKYDSIWAKLYKEQIKLKCVQTVRELIGQICNSLGFVTLIVFLLADLKTGTLRAGDAALYIGLVMTLMSSVEDTCFAFSCFYRDYMQCSGKFKSFLSLRSALDESGTKKINGSPEIEFRNVSFRYPGSENYALRNVSFRLGAGEKLALVGVNGAGKTTLTKLICRFYDPDDGEILFDGVPAADYDIKSLRGLFGELFQDNRIYDMTVRENIMLSDTARDDEQRFSDSCEMSGADSIIEKLPRGYDTEIGRSFGETNYEPSGGERQKLGLARAYYKDAGIIILDEPSSALDAEAEDHIFTRFTALCRDKSAILISHRLSAVAMADKIALMENGELLEYGTHTELIQKNGRYAKLYNMQADAYRESKENE
jgi:ATP-binding cassette subfamily B protein